VVVILAFVVALAATPPAMALARRLDLLDHPGELKVQTSPIPYLGGLGVAAGLTVGVAVARPSLLVPLGMALALGVVDDARHIGAVTRLAAEVAVGVSAAAMLPVRLPGPLGGLAVAVIVVMLINGVNMIDGLDALAAGVALMSALGFAIVLDGDARTIALALAGATAAFLVFNRPPAKVYLGDGGAYLVGTALALLLGLAWDGNRPLAVSFGSLLLVAVPVAELGFAVLRRVRSRRHLFAGDRSHIYDQLVQGGWSPKRAAGAFIVVQAVLGAVAVGAVQLPPDAAGAVVATGGVALLVLAAALGFLRPSYSETAT
jgi:UDP-GlcNAc:undecaprenyl-phosphate GlcNAc-1-phosphate transferase